LEGTTVTPLERMVPGHAHYQTTSRSFIDERRRSLRLLSGRHLSRGRFLESGMS
jgi:hypothetical protein